MLRGTTAKYIKLQQITTKAQMDHLRFMIRNSRFNIRNSGLEIQYPKYLNIKIISNLESRILDIESRILNDLSGLSQITHCNPTFYLDLCPLSSGYLYDKDIDRCIKVYDTIKNYVTSSQACQAEGASLVKVDSYQMWIFVKNNIGMCLNCWWNL